MLATLLMSTALVTSQPPNVLVILTDDQGWGDLSVSGNRNLNTPNIDSLSRDGASFRQFCVQPVCSPTRAEFLTGRYHPRSGVRNVTSGGERLNLNEKTIADFFRNAGYRTGLFGKWHNGSQYPYHPNGRGFDEFYGFTSGHWGDYFDAMLEHNGRDSKGNGFITDDFTDHAIKFVTENSAKPFFCCLTYNAPHSPMQVPDAYWNRFQSRELISKGSANESVPFTRAALAMCENLDDNIGRVLACLKTLKIDDNTIVVYFHDNGPNNDRWNGRLKGKKGSTDDGGVRSPLFFRWPDRIKSGFQIHAVAGAIDLLPTLCDLTSIKRVSTLPLDGVSFAKTLTSGHEDASDRILFNHWNNRTSARSTTHRLDHEGNLYDLTTDPGQSKPIHQPQVKQALFDAQKIWIADVLKDLKKPDLRPFPVGLSAFPRTVLPARDGNFHGGIKRSASAPNCSYFTNWETLKDAMTWSIEVAEAGHFLAEIDVTIPEKNIGAEICLAFGSRQWTGQFLIAHDPPLRGMDQDRVKRVGESYVKDFKTQSLGIIELVKGPGELKLAATKIPGSGVADVRRIILTRQ
jgi:arylsulfatase A-like enzyme